MENMREIEQKLIKKIEEIHGHKMPPRKEGGDIWMPTEILVENGDPDSIYRSDRFVLCFYLSAWIAYGQTIFSWSFNKSCADRKTLKSYREAKLVLYDKERNQIVLDLANILTWLETKFPKVDHMH